MSPNFQYFRPSKGKHHDESGVQRLPAPALAL